MGSLASRPNVPAPQPQVVFVQPPASQNTSGTPPANETPTERSQEQTESESRRQNLLGRERSRFGTVLTGFRGLLGQSDNTVQRKTLLGE